jgi:HNH endonuclease
MPMPAKADPKKHCHFCRARLHRKRMNGRLEDLGVFRRRKFCNKVCAGSGSRLPTVGKQAHMWRARKYRKPACERCGATKRLQVHHKDRDWTNDDPKNLETLCATCHRRMHWAEDGQRQRRRRRMLVEIEAVHALIEMEPTISSMLPPKSRTAFQSLTRRILGAASANADGHTACAYLGTPSSPSRRRSRS